MTQPNNSKNFFTIFIITVLSALVWRFEVPSGLSENAWHLFIIFVATITGIILTPLPMGAVALLSIAACTLTKTLSLKESLSGFSDSVVWLVIFAFFISHGFIQTGLGARIAYYMISRFGDSMLGLSYAFVIVDFVLSPLIPSVSARGGGIIFPIAKSLCNSYSDENHPGPSSRNGGFIMQICAQSNVITSSMFITAMAANPLAVKLAADAGIMISWLDWASAAIVPGIVSLIVMPLALYYLYPPAVKHSDSASKIAGEKLALMGKITFSEIVMLVTFFILIALWIFEANLGLSSTTVALIGLCILLLFRVINFEDNLSDKVAWHTFIWYATLVMLSGALARLGMMTWIGMKLDLAFVAFSPASITVILCLVYFYIHYFFASTTAHITVLFPTFLILFVNANIPGTLAALMLSFLSILSSGLTHYGLSSIPVFFGSGYMKTRVWWSLGLIMSIVYLAIWALIGGVWWKIIGLY